MSEFDLLPPAEMTQKAEDIGVKKANSSFARTFVLGILGGAFIAIGGMFSTIVQAGGSSMPYGIVKFIAGIAFCVGLLLVVVAGAELFTGNCLLTVAYASKKISLWKMIRNWIIVYFGNFLGALIIVALVFFSGNYLACHGQVGELALKIANTKCGLDFVPALLLGILCNIFVCLAVWLTYAARSVTDKLMAILLPIAAFVAAGFEHSVANMYFIPLGLIIKNGAPATFWSDIGKTVADYSAIGFKNFFIGNLLPVTMGNIIGGGILIGLVYWYAYKKLEK